MNKNQNPNCDNDKCWSADDEVRVLPLGLDPNHGNLILCLACFNHEMTYRRQRNRELGDRNQYLIPKWDDLKIYAAE